MTDPGRARLLAAVGIVLALGLPELGIGRLLAPGGNAGDLLIREGVWWAIAAIMIGWIMLVERRPLSSIGFRRPTLASLGWGIVLGIAVTAVIILFYAVVAPMLGFDGRVVGAQRDTLMTTPFWYRLLLVLRAAVCEEILYRGYLIERVELLTGRTWIAVIVSTLAFTAAHVSSWATMHLIPVAIGGLLFAIVYACRRDLPSNMIGHWLSDAAGFLSR